MINISLQQIEYFLTVAECNYFSEAANRLYVSQPAVSKWIGKLEKELGVTLFIRSRDGATLTEKGKYLYSVWRPVFNTISKSVQDIQSFGDPVTKTLRIGCAYSVENIATLDQLVAKYSERYPEVSVKEAVYEYSELNQQLMSGAIDLSISSSFALDGLKHIVYRNIKRINLYIAVSASSELAKYDTLPIELLKDRTFYILSNALIKSGSEGTFTFCLNAGFYPKHIEYMPNLATLRMNIKMDRGIAFCGKFIDEEQESGIKFYPVPQPADAPFTSIAWKPDGLSEEAQNFINMVEC